VEKISKSARFEEISQIAAVQSDIFAQLNYNKFDNAPRFDFIALKR
jgi:hypothetical protein